jgi:predicted HD phosphohydrolase
MESVAISTPAVPNNLSSSTSMLPSSTASSSSSTFASSVPSLSASLSLTPDEVVDKIMHIYDQYGDSDYIGEDVSSVEHAVQAAYCAIQSGVTDPAIIIGSLLHDIGHLLGLIEPDKYQRMGHCGVMAHEGIGGAFLERLGLPPLTCNIVRYHVNAKRYLVWKNPDYYAGLSEASKTTLGFQGGPMKDEEAKEFELDPLFETILAMRRWDEAAKIKGLIVPNIHSYRETIKTLLRQRE